MGRPSLPNPQCAVVDPAKVRDYLLSSEHPIGRYKATVFERAGYRRDRWEELRNDLLQAARLPASAAIATEFGQKLAVLAKLRTPTGLPLHVWVIWLVRNGEDFPRLVTAYPRRDA